MISNEINGIQYVIKNSDDCIQKSLLRGNQWNESIYNFIVGSIQKKNLKHFLNVGCHIGTIALPIAKQIDKVSTIEAYPKTYQHLMENIKLNNLDNVHSYNFAVGNSVEEVYFMGEEEICPVEKCNRLKNNSGGMHIFTQRDIDNGIRSSVLTDKKIIHKMEKLDNTDIDDFDILLVDIEGSEYEFLLGAREKIMKNKPIIIIEIWDDNKRQRENMKWTRKNVIEYILSMGYSLQGSNGEDFLFHHLDDI